MKFFNNMKIFIPLCFISLSGCIQSFDDLKMSKNNSINIDKNTNGIVALKEVFDSSVEKIPTLIFLVTFLLIALYGLISILI